MMVTNKFKEKPLGPWSGKRSHWSCSICQSPVQQRECRSADGKYGCTKTCNNSLFANKTIEDMMRHMIGVHGYAKPAGYDESMQQQKNKQKSLRRKTKKKKQRKQR